LVHRCHDCPIHDAVHVLNLHRSNALADDRYAVLHRGHSDDHLCVTELHRHDAAHLIVDALDGHRNCVRDSDDHHRHVDDLDANRDRRNDHQTTDDQNLGDPMKDVHDRLDDHRRYVDATDDLDDHQNDHELVDGHHHDADDLDDQNQNCAGDLDGHLRCVDVTDGHRRGANGKVVNRHDEGLWLLRHLGVLDGLNHYLVLGDADRFCLV
jgi:hypothetical protein